MGRWAILQVEQDMKDVFTLTGRKHESSREIVEGTLVQVVLRWERLASLLSISKPCLPAIK